VVNILQHMLFVSVSLSICLSLWRSCGWRRWARPESSTFRLRNKQPKICSCERCVSFPAGALPIFTHCTKSALPTSQSSLKCAGPALLWRWEIHRVMNRDNSQRFPALTLCGTTLVDVWEWMLVRFGILFL